MNAAEYAKRIIDADDFDMTERAVTTAVLANPDLLSSLAGEESDLRDEHPAVRQFIDSVLIFLAAYQDGFSAGKSDEDGPSSEPKDEFLRAVIEVEYQRNSDAVLTSTQLQERAANDARRPFYELGLRHGWNILAEEIAQEGD